MNWLPVFVVHVREVCHDDDEGDGIGIPRLRVATESTVVSVHW